MAKVHLNKSASAPAKTTEAPWSSIPTQIVVQEKLVYVDRPVEVVKEVQVEVEKIVHVPKIVFQDREVPKYIETIRVQEEIVEVEVEIPVEVEVVRVVTPGWMWGLLGLQSLTILYILISG